jgi:hypothetical protein
MTSSTVLISASVLSLLLCIVNIATPSEQEQKSELLTNALNKLQEFKTAESKKALLLAAELEHLSKSLSDKDCSVLIEAIEKMKAAGKPLACVLCSLIGYRSERQMKRALQALEHVNPELYQPLVVLCLEKTAASYPETQAVKELLALKDPTVAPFLLKRCPSGQPRGGWERADWSARRPCGTWPVNGKRPVRRSVA